MRLSLSDRDRHALWFGAGIVALVLTVQLATPAIRLIGAPHSRAAHERRLLERDVRILRDARLARSQLAAERETLTRLKHGLLAAQDRISAEAAALQYLESLAQLAEIRLQSIQIDLDRESNSGQYLALPITFALESDVARVFTFLRLIEGGAIMRLCKLRIAPLSLQQPATLSVSGTIVLFALIESRRGDPQ